MRPIRVERLEPRQMLAADSIGVTPEDTGEFLLGTVGVTPVLFESDGTIDQQTQNWTAEEIDQVLAKVTEGVGWWSDTLDTLNTVHTLEFVIDDTFAVDPVETPYEPIDRSSTNFNLYVGDFITAQGYGDVNSIEDGVRRFNQDQREKLGTDWAFTIFMVDSSDDADGLFAAGNSFAAAFAYAGGLFIVTPSTRPASTIAHEMGHIFWARDEYPTGGSWTDQRGYYDTQNLNAPDNPSGSQEISIMRGGVPLTAAYEANVSPESTLAMVGWQDSDGDGVFDLADVPLELHGIGYFDEATSVYRFMGDASAIPLMNRNSSGPQSDITLNEISALQYRLDDGQWVTLREPRTQTAQFDVELPLASPFASIQWRVIDLATGVTSPVLEGTSTLPALTRSSLSGIAFLDENEDGVRNEGETPLANSEVVVRHADGSELLHGDVDAATLPDGAVTDSGDGVELAADGLLHDSEMAVFESDDAGGARVFHAFQQQRDRWTERWSSKVAFTAEFDQPVGEVQIDAIGLGDISFARLEAYDVDGNLIARATSGALSDGQQGTLQLTESLGRIASIRAFGHAGSSIAIAGLSFGADSRVTTDGSGVWAFANLPDGDYLVEVRADQVIHEVTTASQTVSVSDGTSNLIQAATRRVDSPLHNGGLAEDVNRDGLVTASDALVVINDLSRYLPRSIGSSDPSVFAVDVSNDGQVSALDALLVINRIGRDSAGAGEELVVVATGAGGGAQSSASEGPHTEQTDLAMSQMFDSAGSEPDGESTDLRSADKRDQRQVPSEVFASKIVGFFDVGFEADTESIPGEETSRRAATDHAESNQLIHPKISELLRFELI